MPDRCDGSLPSPCSNSAPMTASPPRAAARTRSSSKPLSSDVALVCRSTTSKMSQPAAFGGQVCCVVIKIRGSPIACSVDDVVDGAPPQPASASVSVTDDSRMEPSCLECEAYQQCAGIRDPLGDDLAKTVLPAN